MTDRTMLQFDYEEAHRQNVVAVLGQRDGHAGWQAMAIITEGDAVVLRVDPNSDEIALTFEPAPDSDAGWIEILEMADVIGAPLGWCWVGRNYRGYLAMFTLSFSGLEPQFCFVAEAGTMTIRRIITASFTTLTLMQNF